MINLQRYKDLLSISRVMVSNLDKINEFHYKLQELAWEQIK